MKMYLITLVYKDDELPLFITDDYNAARCRAVNTGPRSGDGVADILLIDPPEEPVSVLIYHFIDGELANLEIVREFNDE